MKKEELLALGIPEDKIKEIQKIHGEDMGKLARKYEKEITAEDMATTIRSALVKVTYLFSVEDLQKLLVFANELYAKSVTEKGE